MAITPVIPLLVVILVGMVGRRTLRITKPMPDATVQRAEDLPLGRRHFWHGNPGMPMLRTTHVAAATALLATLVAWPATSWSPPVLRSRGAVVCV